MYVWHSPTSAVVQIESVARVRAFCKTLQTETRKRTGHLSPLSAIKPKRVEEGWMTIQLGGQRKALGFALSGGREYEVSVLCRLERGVSLRLTPIRRETTR